MQGAEEFTWGEPTKGVHTLIMFFHASVGKVVAASAAEIRFTGWKVKFPDALSAGDVAFSYRAEKPEPDSS